MMISVECPGCGVIYDLKPKYAGRKIRCKNCPSAISVPEQEDTDDLFRFDDIDDLSSDDSAADDDTPPWASPQSRVRKKPKKSGPNPWATPGAIKAYIGGGATLLLIVGFFAGWAGDVAGAVYRNFVLAGPTAEKKFIGALDDFGQGLLPLADGIRTADEVNKLSEYLESNREQLTSLADAVAKQRQFELDFRLATIADIEARGRAIVAESSARRKGGGREEGERAGRELVERLSKLPNGRTAIEKVMSVFNEFVPMMKNLARITEAPLIAARENGDGSEEGEDRITPGGGLLPDLNRGGFVNTRRAFPAPPKFPAIADRFNRIIPGRRQPTPEEIAERERQRKERNDQTVEITVAGPVADQAAVGDIIASRLGIKPTIAGTNIGDTKITLYPVKNRELFVEEHRLRGVIIDGEVLSIRVDAVTDLEFVDEETLDRAIARRVRRERFGVEAEAVSNGQYYRDNAIDRVTANVPDFDDLVAVQILHAEHEMNFSELTAGQRALESGSGASTSSYYERKDGHVIVLGPTEMDRVEGILDDVNLELVERRDDRQTLVVRIAGSEYDPNDKSQAAAREAHIARIGPEPEPGNTWHEWTIDKIVGDVRDLDKIVAVHILHEEDAISFHDLVTGGRNLESLSGAESHRRLDREDGTVVYLGPTDLGRVKRVLKKVDLELVEEVADRQMLIVRVIKAED